MHKSKNLSRSKPVFVILLPIFFVWHGYVQNYPLVPVPDALKLVFEYLVAALLLVFIVYFIFKSWQKAFLFVFFLMCIQFFFGAVHDLLKNRFYTSFIAKYSFLLPFILALLVAVFFFLLKTRRHFNKIT